MPDDGPAPGRWDPERCPYIDPVAEAFLDPDVRVVVLVCGTQMGKTELVFNLLGWTLSDVPRPCLYIGPTEKAVRTQAKDRFDTMVSTTPALVAAADPRSTHQGVLERWFNGARCGFAWAGSGTELRANPAALALVDEREAMTDIPGEGDPVGLARARVSNYHNNKIGIFSSPGLEGISPTWSWWERGTRERWALLCADCRKWFVPCKDLLTWPEGATGRALVNGARLLCQHCSRPYDDQQRRALEGAYIPHKIDAEGNLVAVDELPDSTIRSFWVSGLVSPFRTIGELADIIAGAFRTGDPGEIQSAINTAAGECYGLEGDTPGHEAVLERASPYSSPAGISFVTAGVDVQQESLYWVVRGWGYNAESWLLGYGQLWGATAYDDVWIALATVLEREHGGHVPVLTLVDSGYHADQVYAFCRRHPRVDAAKGHDTLAKPHYDALADEQRTGKVVKTGVRLWHVSTDHYKSWIYGRIRWPAGAPGAWHVPLGLDEDYARQVTNEQRCHVKGKAIWKTTGNRQNHYLDAEMLATCAAFIMNVSAVRAPPDPDAEPAPAPAPDRVDGVRVPPGMQRRGL